MKIARLISILTLSVLLSAILNTRGEAQNFATLVADKVWIAGDNTLNAEGHVEVLFKSTRIKADKISYNKTADTLKIEGPIQITQADGTVIHATSATFSDSLRNGVIQSAKLVLNQQLQIAAVEIQRVGGRYTQMYKTVASSCRVCAGSPIPLWQIRASRIVHDQLERQLYFDNAVLKVMDIPIFYIPRLRLPDPTLKRATGFLIPQLISNSELGFGLKIPYFIRIGDHADVTLIPLFATKSKTLEYKFRRAFRKGDIAIQGAFSRDNILPGKTRGYVFATSAFDLRNDFKLQLHIEAVTDHDYLAQYGFSSKDRLDSAISLGKVKRNLFFAAELIQYNSLRSTENNLTQPTTVGNLTFQQRFHPEFIGGDFTVTLDAHSQFRRSNTLGDTGRDLSRMSMRADWRRDWTMQNGMQLEANLNANADLYAIKQGLPGEFSGTQFTPSASVKLQWPFVKTMANGASQVLEPIAQIAWTQTSNANIPNEDSRLVEFDEGNLFSLARFPGADRYERGKRANLGLRWTRFDPNGWSMGVTIGRIFRAGNTAQFQTGTGLSGVKSNWLTAANLKLKNGFSLTNRALINDRFDFTKNETRLKWEGKRINLASSYLWMKAEPFENRPTNTSELTYYASYELTPYWTVKTNGRYDFVAGRTAYSGVGLEFRNECAKIDLSLSRRYTSSASLTPTTNFGLTVSLTGFGSSGAAKARARNCQ